MGSVRGNAFFPTCMENIRSRSEVAFPIEGTGEGHVVQGSRWSPRSLVGCHSADAVLGLLSWQLPPQLFRGDVVLGEKKY